MKFNALMGVDTCTYINLYTNMIRKIKSQLLVGGTEGVRISEEYLKKLKFQIFIMVSSTEYQLVSV